MPNREGVRSREGLREEGQQGGVRTSRARVHGKGGGGRWRQEWAAGVGEGAAHLIHGGKLADHPDAAHHACLQGRATPRVVQQVHLVDQDQGDLRPAAVGAASVKG